MEKAEFFIYNNKNKIHSILILPWPWLPMFRSHCGLGKMASLRMVCSTSHALPLSKHTLTIKLTLNLFSPLKSVTLNLERNGWKHGLNSHKIEMKNSKAPFFWEKNLLHSKYSSHPEFIPLIKGEVIQDSGFDYKSVHSIINCPITIIQRKMKVQWAGWEFRNLHTAVHTSTGRVHLAAGHVVQRWQVRSQVNGTV